VEGTCGTGRARQLATSDSQHCHLRYVTAPEGATCQAAGLLDISTRDECFKAARNFLAKEVPDHLLVTRHVPWAGGCKISIPEFSPVQYLEFNTNFQNQHAAIQHHRYICVSAS